MTPFWLALQFLTRLPIPSSVNYDEAAMRQSVAFYPAVGLILGSLLAAVDYLLLLLFDNVYITSLFVLVTYVILTGALHIDGLMDTCDGLFSNKPREKMLEIMRDSRVGAIGAVGGMLLLLSKYVMLTQMPLSGRTVMILLIPMISRCGIAVAMAIWPYARRQQEGVGGSLTRNMNKSVWLTAVVSTVFITILGLQVKGVILLAVLLIILMATAGYTAKRLGGLTGDTYGMINEVLEVMGWTILIFFDNLLK